MNSCKIVITNELACHRNAVEELGAKAFGPGRFARTAFRLRENSEFEKKLSFVALKKNEVVGCVRITRIIIGMRPGLVLGPLVVDPVHVKEGIGGLLMQISVNACRLMANELIILVGDEPYYKPFGFKKIPVGQITLPGPVDPARFLYCELEEGCLTKFSGLARAFSTLDH